MASSRRPQQQLDSHGRVPGGLFEACGATNYVLRTTRVDSATFAPVPPTALFYSPPIVRFSPLTSTLPAGFINNNSASSTTAAAAAAAAAAVAAAQPEKRRNGGRSKQKTSAAAAPAPPVVASTPPPLVAQSSSSSGAGAAAIPLNFPPTPTSAAATAPAAAAPAVHHHHHKKPKPELFCLCKSPYQAHDTRFMIGCDGGCEDWFHPECLGYYRVERKGHPESFFDVDNTRLDEQTTEFLCPNCELVKASAYPQTRKVLFGQLISKWADVVDLGGSVRWQLLVDARARLVGDAAFAVCALCTSQHHPMLPCPSAVGSNDASQLVCREEQLVVKFQSTQAASQAQAQQAIVHALVGGDDGFAALVVAGKYQGMTGRIIHANKRVSLLRVEDGEGGEVSLLLLPHGHVFVGQLTPRHELEEERRSFYHGVRRTTTTSEGQPAAFSAALKLPDGAREIFLGKFESPLRAARVHDVAYRLEFGSSGTGTGMLNFPDVMEEGDVAAALCARGPFPLFAASPSTSGVAVPATASFASAGGALPAPGIAAALGGGSALASAAAPGGGGGGGAGGLAAAAAAVYAATTLRDALRVVDWCEGLLQCVRGEDDAASRRMEHMLCFLASAVQPSAKQQMAKLCASLEHLPLQADANEDEMDLVMKKLVRARTPRVRNRGA